MNPLQVYVETKEVSSHQTRQQQLPTSGTLESPLGNLELKNGYPTDATAKKIYDDIDFQRACQAYLWALPIMSMVQWQGEQHKFGAGKRINLTKTLG